MEVTNSVTSSGGFLAIISQFFGSFLMILFQLIGITIVIFLVNKIVSKLFFLQQLNRSENEQKKIYFLVKTSRNNEQKEGAMEDFLRTLHRILPNNTCFSLEMASTEQFLKFFIVIPNKYKQVIESQLFAQYPDAEAETVKDYLPQSNNSWVVEEMKFKRAPINPISTYKKEGQEDLLKPLSAILSKTEPGEQVFIQFALKRIGSKFWQRGLGGFLFILNGKKYQQEEIATPAYVKFSQDLYEGRLRIAYQAKDVGTAKTKLSLITGLFKALKSRENEIVANRWIFFTNLKKAFIKRVFEEGDFWTPSEIATLYHLPYKGAIISNVVDTTTKRAPAPDILPIEGLVDPKEVSFFGETNYRNERKKFGIKRIDRRRHIYVVGKTGSGKSRLLELLLISDIQHGHGCCLLDPHGDLADELLMYIPKDRIKEVVYINPSDREFPIGFNPLESVKDYETRQHLSTFFIAIFKKLFAASWNPRMEHLIRYLTLALLETPDSNVLGIPRMLSDTTFRQRVIMQIQDPVVKGFWTTEFSSANEQYSKEAVVPILNKVGQFVANPTVRNMVGQRKNMLDFRKFMDEGKIVIINISKGKLGDENSALLGSMFITKIQQAALSRASIKEEERKDFYFYVDEFQNFATESFSSILSEARKYHLNLTIAHQYIAQLPEEVKATAFGNVGSLIVFAVGGDDANYLAKEFVPVFTPEDLINLNNRELYIKMSIDGKLTPPFSARTLTVPRPTQDFSEEVISYSRLTYGKNRVSVENEIARLTQSANPTSEEGSEDKFPEPII